ncbi:MAG: quinolinate synthase NadA [Acidimicrobiales bacterium]
MATIVPPRPAAPVPAGAAVDGEAVDRAAREHRDRPDALPRSIATLLHATAALVWAGAFTFYLRVWLGPRESDGSIGRSVREVVGGTADAPFQYRILVPQLLDRLHDALGWPYGYGEMVVDLVALTVAVAVTAALLRRLGLEVWVLAVALVGAQLTIGAMWWGKTETYAALAAATVGLWAVLDDRRRRWLPLLAAAAVLAGTRTDLLLALGIAALARWALAGRERRPGRRRRPRGRWAGRSRRPEARLPDGDLRRGGRDAPGRAQPPAAHPAGRPGLPAPDARLPTCSCARSRCSALPSPVTDGGWCRRAGARGRRGGLGPGGRPGRRGPALPAHRPGPGHRRRRRVAGGARPAPGPGMVHRRAVDVVLRPGHVHSNRRPGIRLHDIPCRHPRGEATRLSPPAPSGITTTSEAPVLRLQTPLPERYRDATPEALDEMIGAAKAALGDRLFILGHHYQRDEVMRWADAAATRTACRCWPRNGPARGLHRVLRRALHGRVGRCAHRRPPGRGPARPERRLLDGRHGRPRRGDRGVGRPVGGDRHQPPGAHHLHELGAALKAFVGEHGGAVCTSTNAREILEWAFTQGDKVLFFPDQHLGRNTGIAMGYTHDDMRVWNPRLELGGLGEDDVRDATFLLWKGHCSVHQRFTPNHVAAFRAEHPDGIVIAHPECAHEVCSIADEVGSTDYIIKAVAAAPCGQHDRHRHRDPPGQPPRRRDARQDRREP